MHNLNLEKKTAVQPVIVASGRSLQKRNFDLSARNLTGKPMKLNLGFPWCKTNSKQEKKREKKKRPRVNWSASSALKFTGVACKDSNDPHGN